MAHITRDSSSNPIINPGYPGVVDAKREPDEVTDGGFKSSSFEEEGVTGDRVTGDRVTGDRVTGDRVTEGRVTEGRVTEGRVTEGRVTEGQVTEGRVTEGQVTEGRVTEGRVTEGRVTEGRVTEGRVTEGRVTEGQLTVEDIQEWVDGHLSETPLPFEIQQVGKHCWPAWSKHWDLDLAGAIVVWTKTEASRRKFRKDVVMHLGKVGLPKPKQADPEDQAARERERLVMDQRLSTGPKRRFNVKCMGCGQRRQLKPGELLCYLCRKEVVEIAA